MATLAVQTPGLTGVTPTYNVCAAGGDQFANTGRIILHFKNTNAAARNVTINSQLLCNQGSDHNITLNVPLTTGEKIIGPFSKGRFDDANGFVQLTYDAVSDLTVALYETTP